MENSLQLVNYNKKYKTQTENSKEIIPSPLVRNASDADKTEI